MMVGVLNKGSEMKLEKVADGVYNIYAPDRLDFEFILNHLRNPPEDAEWYMVFSSNSNPRFPSLMKYTMEWAYSKGIKYPLYSKDIDGVTFYYIKLR